MSRREDQDTLLMMAIYKPLFTANDASTVSARIRELLRDPVYKYGVTSHSVDNMVVDIVRVMLGETNNISVPEPVRGFAPMGYVSIKDKAPLRPGPLSAGVENPISRRWQGYNLMYGGNEAKELRTELQHDDDSEYAIDSSEDEVDGADDVMTEVE